MIGKQLRFFRKQAKLSQKQLAEKIDHPQTTISDWELDKYEPGFTVVIKITEVLGITLLDLTEYRSTTEKEHSNS